MKYKILSEDELIHEALNGSESHLNLLISMYEPFIMEHLEKQIKNRQDSLDLRQRVCCKIAEHISQKTYVHQEKFTHWTSSIVKNEINSYFRKKRQNIVSYFSSPDIDEMETEFYMASEETLIFKPNLSFFVDELPAEQAVVIKLRYFQNKTFREISEVLDVPLNTIMGRYRYGIEKIREMMTLREKRNGE
ncbi:MAG: sigma-70 family RNA polymerase sigma factor [Bacteroidales bacterium]|jgi:RNA polymerase sigma-70 factor (ECF subfamily)|nr:sigma-70 family RNA polymerase sigma factor [Bacteroidales bacterium]